MHMCMHRDCDFSLFAIPDLDDMRSNLLADISLLRSRSEAGEMEDDGRAWMNEDFKVAEFHIRASSRGSLEKHCDDIFTKHWKT